MLEMHSFKKLSVRFEDNTIYTDLPVVVRQSVPPLGGPAAQTLVEPPGLGGRVDGEGPGARGGEGAPREFPFPVTPGSRSERDLERRHLQRDVWGEAGREEERMLTRKLLGLDRGRGRGQVWEEAGGR